MRDDGSSGLLPGFAGALFDDLGATASFAALSRAGRSARSSSGSSSSTNRRATNRALVDGFLPDSEPVPTKKAPKNALAPFALHQGDAVEWLRTLPSCSVDLLITDPPYESLEKHRAVGTTTRLKHSKASSNDWFQIFPNSRFAELFSEVYRVLARNSHFYLFCDQETMFVAKPIAEQCGFRFWKPLVWDKQKIGMGYHYRARYEFVLFFEKGKRKLNDLGIPDVIQCARIRNGYPTEKPVYVSEVLIGQSSNEGELVVDPFMGSASVGVAALQSNRRFMGSDLSETALTLSRSRLSAIAPKE